MDCHGVPLPGDGQGPPRPTVGEIARTHGDAFKRQHALTEAQRKVLRAVSACRTPVLGGREVKSAVVFSDENHLRGTAERRGQISQAHYVSVLGDQDAFKKVLSPTLQVMNAARAAMVVWLADGARGNWGLAGMLAPRAIQILDWFHAVEHASDCAKLLFGEGDLCARLFSARVEHLLISGQVKRCIKELQDTIEFAPGGAALKSLTELLSYYRENERRMRYDDYVGRGLLIGSGAIESAHRHVIQRRMKQAGQHWGERGGRRMARMRAAHRHSRPSKRRQPRRRCTGAHVGSPLQRRRGGSINLGLTSGSSARPRCSCLTPQQPEREDAEEGWEP
jgi:hypothetical protein